MIGAALPRPMRPAVLAPLCLLVLLLTGCGVSFSEDFDGTELFKSIRLEGELETDAELTVTVSVNQGYPVPVHVACYYEDGSKLTDDQLKLAFQERATRIGDEVLLPAAGATPGDDVERRELSFHFRIGQPGEYFLACLTPAAPENGLGRAFTIERDRDAPLPTPTPGTRAESTGQ
jgi:hypothetical protein